MNLFGFDIDWKNLSTKQITIFVTSLLVTFSIVVGAFTMNSGLFKGEVGDTPDTGAGSEEECDEISSTYLEYLEDLESTLDAFNTGVSVVVDDEEVIDDYKVLASGLLTLIDSVQDPVENDCIEIATAVSYDTLGDLPETIPEIVELINDMITEFNSLIDGCEVCEVTELSILDLEFSCSSDLIYNEDSQSCQEPPAPVCSFTEIYNNIVLANTLLDSKKNSPSSFSTTDQSTLRNYLQSIATLGATNLFSTYTTNFNYQQQGSTLSQQLVNLVVEIKAQDTEGACTNIVPLTVVQVIQPAPARGSEGPDLLGALNGNTSDSCPANSVLDEDLDECYCPLIDNYILPSETCGSSNNNRPAPTEEPDLVCSNGVVVDKLSDCELFEDEEDKKPNTVPEDPIFDAKDLPGGNYGYGDDDVPVNQNGEFEEEEEQELGLDEEPEMPNGQQPNLNTNTNANVLGAGVVQGNTGPGIWLAILIAIIGTVAYSKISKKN